MNLKQPWKGEKVRKLGMLDSYSNQNVSTCQSVGNVHLERIA